MATEDSAPAPATARSRSIFSKRPAWAQPATGSIQTDAPDELFTRRNLDPDELLRQQEDRHHRESERAKRKEHAKAEKEKRKSAESNGAHDEERKRRRISDQTYAAFGLRSPTKRDNEEEAEDGPSRSEYHQDKPSPRNRETHSNKVTQPPNVISLDSDGEPDVLDHAADEPRADSEDEFPELVALAKERRRKREAEEQAAKDRSSKAAKATSLAEKDPIIKVLVTSPIENTNPLLVHRKLSQRLMEIRQVWCQRQGFTEDEAQSIFLTYKLRRVYDVTTCKSLGIKVDDNGRVVGDRPEDVFRPVSEDPDAGNVHLIALTEESFELMKKQREEERVAAATAALPLVPDDEDEGESASTSEGETKIRVLVKSSLHKDYKLIVRPNTTCERILAAFRREYKIDHDQALVLTFDGEAIEPEDKIQDTEVEDMDNLEVHFR